MSEAIEAWVYYSYRDENGEIQHGRMSNVEAGEWLGMAKTFLSISPEMLDAMEKRIAARGWTRSKYIQDLVRKDLEPATTVRDENPKTTWDSVVTRADLDGLEARINAKIHHLKLWLAKVGLHTEDPNLTDPGLSQLAEKIVKAVEDSWPQIVAKTTEAK